MNAKKTFECNAGQREIQLLSTLFHKSYISVLKSFTNSRLITKSISDCRYSYNEHQRTTRLTNKSLLCLLLFNQIVYMYSTCLLPAKSSQPCNLRPCNRNFILGAKHPWQLQLHKSCAVLRCILTLFLTLLTFKMVLTDFYYCTSCGLSHVFLINEYKMSKHYHFCICSLYILEDDDWRAWLTRKTQSEAVADRFRRDYCTLAKNLGNTSHFPSWCLQPKLTCCSATTTIIMQTCQTVETTRSSAVHHAMLRGFNKFEYIHVYTL